jgi:hypothetical protein
MGKVLWPNGGTRRPNISAEGHFGWRNASTPGASKYHRGVDMWGLGIVRSIADGLVVHVGWGHLVGWGGGYQVWIQHDGFFTRSLHLRDGSATVRKGDRVAAGDPIGVEGHTGTYEDHLHLEVTPGQWHTGNYGQVDPVPFIQARLSPGAPASVPGQPNSTTPTTEEEEMPEHENKRYVGTQKLEQHRAWPIRLSGTDKKPEHRFAATHSAKREVGILELVIVFGGGTPGDAIANVRFEHKGKTRTVLTEPVEVVATSGGTVGQVTNLYDLPEDFESRVLVQALQPGVTIARVEYRKNYTRS